MWIVFPAKPTTPIPRVSKSYVKELVKLDRRVRKVHRQLDHVLADKVEEVFDGLKVFIAQMESATRENGSMLTTWYEAKIEFERLLDQILSFTIEINSNHQDTLINKLDNLRKKVHQAGQAALQSELENGARDNDAWQAWKLKIQPLNEQLKKRAGPHVLSIMQRIEHKLSYLFGQTNELFDLSRFEVNQIANNYLPDALNEYLKLPSELAKSQRLRNNFTAEELLSEQLIRLDHALEELTTSLFEKDAQGLLIHGRFLKDRFASQSFKIDE